MTVNGHVESNLAKRRAILRYIKALVESGVHSMAIGKAIAWRTVVYDVPKGLGGRDFKYLHKLVFSADGNHLAAWGGDDTIQFFQ